MAKNTVQPPAEAAVIEVSAADLPLACPRPGEALWKLHPRVYLPIESEGEVVCPYCGARYRLDQPLRSAH